MPQIIHMDTEIVSNLSNSIKKFANNIGESTESLNGIVKSLAWEGSSREELVSQASILLTNVSDLKLKLAELSQQLTNEIEQWIEADNGFDQISIPILGKFGENIQVLWRPFRGKFRDKLHRDINDIFNYFTNNKEGIQLLEECKAANLRFEYVNENGEKFYFGSENGKTIPINWVEPTDIPKAKGEYSPNESAIKINNELMSSFSIRSTLAHEIQHAIDIETGRVNLEMVNHPYIELSNINFITKSQAEINTFNWDSLEKEFGKSISEQVHTEITARSREFKFDEPWDALGLEKYVNMDDTYTSQEYNFILKLEGYGSWYEQNLENNFLELGLDANINIYWNESINSITVDISDVHKI